MKNVFSGRRCKASSPRCAAAFRPGSRAEIDCLGAFLKLNLSRPYELNHHRHHLRFDWTWSGMLALRLDQRNADTVFSGRVSCCSLTPSIDFDAAVGLRARKEWYHSVHRGWRPQVAKAGQRYQ